MATKKKKDSPCSSAGSVTLAELYERDAALLAHLDRLNDRFDLLVRLIDDKKCDNCKSTARDLEYFETRCKNLQAIMNDQQQEIVTLYNERLESLKK